MLVAGHTSALRRRSEIRAMPETEKPPAMRVDIYLPVNRKWSTSNKKTLKIFRSLHIIFINLIAYNIKINEKNYR